MMPIEIDPNRPDEQPIAGLWRDGQGYQVIKPLTGGGLRKPTSVSSHRQLVELRQQGYAIRLETEDGRSRFSRGKDIVLLVPPAVEQ